MAVSDSIPISKGYRIAIIVLSVLEIVFALCAVALCIPTLTFTLDTFYDCYHGLLYNPDTVSQFDCIPHYAIYWMSLTSQGIWTGAFVIISGSMNLKFAVCPARHTGAASIGFSTLAVAVSIAMIVLEVFPVADYHHHTHREHDHLLWSLHCALLACACVLFVLTFVATVLSSLVHGCCCRRRQRVPPGASIAAGTTELTVLSRPYQAMPANVTGTQHPQQQQQVVPMVGQYVLTPSGQNIYVQQPLSGHGQLQQPIQLAVPQAMTFRNYQGYTTAQQPTADSQSPVSIATPQLLQIATHVTADPNVYSRVSDVSSYTESAAAQGEGQHHASSGPTQTTAKGEDQRDPAGNTAEDEETL